MIKDEIDIDALIKGQEWPEPSSDLKERLYALAKEQNKIVLVQYRKKHFALLSCFLMIGFVMGVLVGTANVTTTEVVENTTKVEDIAFSYESTGTLIANHLIDQIQID